MILACLNVIVVLGVSVVEAQPRTFTLDVAPRQGKLGEVFTATVRVEVEGVGGPERYWKPSFRGFEVLDARVHPGQYLSSDPGKPTLVSSRLYVYQLRAKHPGRATIEAAKVRIRGKDFKTKSSSVLVLAGEAATTTADVLDPLTASGGSAPGFVPPNIRGTPPIFLHVVADKKNPYVGEQVTVTWLLYSMTDVMKYEPEVPRLDNLWSEVLFEAGQRFQYIDTRVNGQPYYVVPLVKRAVFPTRSGVVPIPPFGARIAVPQSRLGRPERIESAAVELVVKPLPPNSPPGFDPTYVGVFEISSKLDRTALPADESMTLELTVRGEGAIRRTAAPMLHFPRFNFRAPRDYDESIDTSTDIVRGERTYRYWTTPEKGGPQELPAVTLPFFNPRTEKYEVATSPPISIVVRGEPTAATSPSARDRASGRDIRLIASRSSISSRTAGRWYGRWWFWILCALPGCVFLLIDGSDRVRQRLRRETPRARLRRARGKAKQRFRVAEIHLRGNRPAKFFGELAHVLYETLEEQLRRPVQALTREELAETLRERGFAASTILRITTDLDVFDMARFAPSATASEDMKTALRRVKALLREIERTTVIGGDDDEDEDE